MWVPPEQLSEYEPQRDPVAAAAEEYAARGWQVLPVHHPGPDGVCSCANGQCSSPGKHPRTARGFKDATTDLETIRAWFARWPNSNVAIRTGSASGLVVLDVDPRNGGLESLAQLIREHGQLPDTVVAATGGGGFHFFFRYPSGRQVPKRTLADGIDLCSDGGYVIVAPSLHASGRRYEWLESPNQRPPAALPGQLIDLATASWTR